jgi:hypothetical protein
MLHTCTCIRDPHRPGSLLTRHRNMSPATVSACHHHTTPTTVSQGSGPSPAGLLLTCADVLPQ